MLICSGCSEEYCDIPSGSDTTEEVVVDEFEFSGRKPTRNVPAWECPECGETNVL